MQFKFLSILTFCLFLLSAANAQDKWDLRKNDHGFKIYSRRSSDGRLVELKLLCQFDATEDQLIKELLNIDDYTHWVYSNRKSGVIKRVNDHDVIYFTESHLPWPIQDRDLVIELNITPATATTPLTAIAKSVDGILPPKKHFIRIPYSVSTWHITPAPGNKLNIEYTFSVDPGGSIPTWLANLTIATGPYKSFMKLGEILKADKNKG